VIALDAAQSRHGLGPLRLGPGRPLELTGPWGLAPAVVEGVANQDGRPALLVRLTGPFVVAGPIEGPTLALALVKGPRFDWAVEKAAELGAEALVPLLTARTAVSAAGEAKRSRWARLAEEARKQCGRPTPMAVLEPRSLQNWLASGPPSPLVLLDPEGGPFPDGLGGRGSLLVGPEGGLTSAERSLAQAAGFDGARLGPIRLRAETAALAALARWARTN
jgi:16S rRNA (uracil1498-N3)-methyltransferase